MATIIETYSGGLRVECEHTQSGTKIITDAPTDNNGKGEAFSPTDLCCAALGACAMTIIGIWAEKRDVDVRGTRVEVNKTMAADPRRIGKIEGVFKMPARNYSDKEKIMMEKAARSCPVHLSLGADVEQVFTFIWQDSREDQPY